MKALRCFFFVASGLFIALHHTFAQNLTFTTNAYVVGRDLLSVAVADVNGDGKLDLISANALNNTLLVLTNDGNGSFGSNAIYSVGGNPRCVVAADINGDGKLDLITANGGGGTVLTNDGSGAFGLYATLNGSHQICVAAADVNNDGKMDLISAYRLQVTVLTNSGSGFGATAAVTVGDNPVSIAVADINGDGKPDLITANSYDATLTVLTNSGNGNFGSNATLTLQANLGPQCVVMADINGDGKPDVVCADSSTAYPGGMVIVLTNNGSGIFGSNYMFNAANSASFVAAADVNGDGKLDLITANYSDNTLIVLMNTSVFPPPVSVPTLTITHQGNAVQVAWPSDSPGWSLQQNPDLAKTNWLPSGYGGYAITDDGTNKSLTLPLPMDKIFFRLLHP